MNKCEECPFFKMEKCSLSKRKVAKEEECSFEKNERSQLTNDGALQVLHYSQKWRRGDDIPMPSPILLGKAIDAAIRMFRVNKRK